MAGTPQEYFKSPITVHDERRFKFAIGDSKGQQSCEGLSVLVALRAWRKFWTSSHTALMLQGDNIAALTMACRMKAKAGPMKAIAREVALEFSRTTIMPHLAQHIAGVTNVLADWLSRRFEPGTESEPMPAALLAAKEIQVPVRTSDYFRVPVARIPRRRGK